MNRRSIMTAAVVALLIPVSTVAPATAQSGNSSASLERSLRVFTVVAALNVAGFDVDLAPQYHPVRQRVRDELESLDPDLVARLEAFFEQHREDIPVEDELSRYVGLALSLTDPPEMRLEAEGMFLPPEVRELTEFAPLLSEFYREADLIQLWTRLAPDYNRELDRMVSPLRRMVERTDAYLRETSGPREGRRMVAYLELTAPFNSVFVKNYPDNLYLVLGPTDRVPESDVRHAYLHLLLDPIVARNRATLSRSEDILDFLDGITDVSGDHVDDFEIMVVESMIRSVEMRLDGVSDDQAEIDAAYRSGLLLVPFLTDQLVEFETRPTSMSQYFGDIVAEIDVDYERERFDTTFLAIEAPTVEPMRASVPVMAPAPDPVRLRLADAQQAFNAGDNEAARQAFQDVLDQTGAANGPALYGMGLLASRDGDPDMAMDYFQRTIASADAEPGMKVWSHIFVGRIQDIACRRDVAVEAYRAALALGNDTNNARAAAERGLAEPYGGGC